MGCNKGCDTADANQSQKRLEYDFRGHRIQISRWFVCQQNSGTIRNSARDRKRTPGCVGVCVRVADGVIGQVAGWDVALCAAELIERAFRCGRGAGAGLRRVCW